MTEEEYQLGLLVLNLWLPKTDVGSCTVREYLRRLLLTLWREKAGFSGKRPWGNSSWEAPIEFALVRAGVVSGSVDEGNGWVDRIDQPAADRVVELAIKAMDRIQFTYDLGPAAGLYEEDEEDEEDDN